MDDWPNELKGYLKRQQEIWRLMGQLQNEVGKLVILSSDMDNKLHLLFMALIAPADDRAALKVLADQQSTEKKVNLVNLLIEMQCTDEEKLLWASVHVVLNESRAMRNLVAHQSAWISNDDNVETMRVFLGPHTVAPRIKKEATAGDVGEICNRILTTRTSMLRLVEMIVTRKGLMSTPVEG